MLEINLSNLSKNVRAVTTANRKLIAVVKNDAYGCGALAVSRHLVSIGVDFLLVNDIYEAVPLLEDGINVKILVHNSVPEQMYNLLKQYGNLVVTINSLADAISLSKAEVNNINVHIQIDTKMNRLGIKDLNEFDKTMEILKANSKFNIDGIYTHFASPKTMDEQLCLFKQFTKKYDFPNIHCAATSTFSLTDYGNYVRVGLGLYDINQVMSVKTKPIVIKDIKAGEAVGYESEYVAHNDTKVAVLPIGYGDGYRRRFEGFYVMANGVKYNIIGRICMNHIFVEIDDNVSKDTVFEILSENLPASVLGKYANCSNYEIYTMFKVHGVEYKL